MHASALPTIADIGSLLAYVFGNPYLFISSTTAMTSGLLLGAVVVSVRPQRTHTLRRGAPTLVLILGYFGLGSIVLSSEILLRFHATIPDETEIQFVSGLGHLAEAAVGIALLIPFARRHIRTEWLWGHTLAVGYWTFQVAVLTPPWFAFQVSVRPCSSSSRSFWRSPRRRTSCSGGPPRGGEPSGTLFEPQKAEDPIREPLGASHHPLRRAA